MNVNRLTNIFLVGLVCVIPTEVLASIWSGTGTGSSANNLAASLTITKVGDDLQVVLTNTTAEITLKNQDVLMGVSFDVASGFTLVAKSATASGFLDLGNNLLSPSNSGDAGYNDVSNEWAYLQTGNSISIGTSGRDGLGASDIIDSTANDRNNGATAPDGADFGIVSSSTTVANTDINKNKSPYIQNSATFLLSGELGDDFDIADSISSVLFVYGTSTSEPSFPGTPPGTPPGGGGQNPIPEPTALLVWSLLIGMGVAYRRYR